MQYYYKHMYYNYELLMQKAMPEHYTFLQLLYNRWNSNESFAPKAL